MDDLTVTRLKSEIEGLLPCMVRRSQRGRRRCDRFRPRAVDWDQDRSISGSTTFNTENDTNNDGDFDDVAGGVLAIGAGRDRSTTPKLRSEYAYVGHSGGLQTTT